MKYIEQRILNKVFSMSFSYCNYVPILIDKGLNEMGTSEYKNRRNVLHVISIYANRNNYLTEIE